MPRIKNASNSPVKAGGVLSERDHVEEGCTPRVVGSRIGTAKSSGLLVDDRKPSQACPSADGYAFMTSGLTDDVSSQPTGRDMYSFQNRPRGPSGKEGHVRSGNASLKQNRKIPNGACSDEKPVRTARRSALVLGAKERADCEESSASDEEAAPVEARGGTSEASNDADDNSGKQKLAGASISRRVPTRYEHFLFLMHCCFHFPTLVTSYSTCHTG